MAVDAPLIVYEKDGSRSGAYTEELLELYHMAQKNKE